MSHVDRQDLCDDCQQLNLQSILSPDPAAPDQEFSLDYIDSTTDCDLCEFFRKVKITFRNPGTIETYSFSAILGRRPSIVIGLQAHSMRSMFMTESIWPKDVKLLSVAEGYSDKSGTGPFDSTYYNVISAILPHGEKYIVSGRLLDPERIDYSLVQSWLSYCGDHHTQLCKKKPLAVGITVIDCETRELVLLPHPDEKYVALSYVWGTVVVTSSTTAGSTLEDVPPTIEDAMTVVLELGLKYLWVDRYCIPQDDVEERKSQIQQMGSIYSCASLTIIAVAGEDPTHGLPGVGATSRKPQPFVQVGETILVSTLTDIKQEIDESKWNQRGWTFQEGMLSQKRLVFTDNQIYFQCMGMHCLESVSVPLGDLHISSLQHFRDDISTWKAFPNIAKAENASDMKQYINQFSPRQLSQGTDALKAFQGILERFNSLEDPTDHLWGIPLFSSHNFARQGLGGTREVSSAVRLAFGMGWEMLIFKGRISRRSCFSSWSWLGWKLEGSDTSIIFQEDANWEHHIKVSVEVGGDIVPWELLDKSIRHETDVDRLPVFLRVRGFVFDLKPSLWMKKPKFLFKMPSGSAINEFSGLQAYTKA
jgi:hypothetical protein